MADTGKETVRDYLTGRDLPYCDDEYVRQGAEKLLVEDRGYTPDMIRVEPVFEIHLDGETHPARIDLLVYVKELPFMAVKCARGSLVTRERETLAAARLMLDAQVPLSVVFNGDDAHVLDTLTGRVLGEGLEAIPNREKALSMAEALEHVPLPAKRRDKEARIYLAFQTFQCPTECEV